MEHPEFRAFLQEYFLDETRAEAMMSFVKLYLNIERSSPGFSTGYQKIAAMKRCMDNAEVRGMLYNQRPQQKFIGFKANHTHGED